MPDGTEATTHVSFNESFAQGLIDDAQLLGAEAIVVGAVTGELLYPALVPLALAPRGAGTRRWIESAR